MSKNGVHRQILATLVATLSVFITGIYIGWPSAVTDKFKNHEIEINVSDVELPWIVSLLDFGSFISPLSTGYFMDTVGRKFSIAALGPLFIITWLMILYAPTIWILYVARFIAGLGLGMACTVVPIFLGEITNPNIRGVLGSVFCSQMSFGAVFVTIIGPLVSYRTLNIISAIVSVVFFLTILWIPESPYYLLRKNRYSDAAKSLQWFMCKDNVDVEIQQMEINVKKEMENQSTFGEVFSSRKDIKALTIVLMGCITLRAGGMSCLIAYPTLILPDPAPLINKSGYVITFVTIMAIMNFVGMALVKIMGRKPLITFSQTGMAIINLIFTIYFYLRVHMDMSRFVWLPYSCYLCSIFISIGVGLVPIIFLGELFPVNIRSQCSVIVSMVSAISTFIPNNVFPSISTNYGFHVMFCIFTVINTVGAIYSYKYVIETKDKTFLEIQELLNESVCTRHNQTE